MTTHHTPGPWRIGFRFKGSRNESPYRMVEGDGVGVAHVYDVSRIYERQYLENEAEGEANARLIAAAPELLAALQDLHGLANDPAGSRLTLREVFGTFQHSTGNGEIDGQRAMAAIAKATLPQ